MTIRTIPFLKGLVQKQKASRRKKKSKLIKPLTPRFPVSRSILIRSDSPDLFSFRWASSKEKSASPGILRLS